MAWHPLGWKPALLANSKISFGIQSNIIGRTPENGGNGNGFSMEVSPTLTKSDRHGVAFGIGENPETAHCLRSGASKADKHESTTYIAQSMQVRRLTPRECERLQGFPDDYTKISETTADSPRYKAIGNSWAVPKFRWLGERIQMVENLINPPKPPTPNSNPTFHQPAHPRQRT